MNLCRRSLFQSSWRSCSGVIRSRRSSLGYYSTAASSQPFEEPPVVEGVERAVPPPKEPVRDLPSALEQRRSDLSRRMSARLDELQATLFTAGQKLNDVTGYSSIEALKKRIVEQESQLLSLRSAIRAAKQAYTEAIASRSSSQREVNELLQRKHTWLHHDVERFTELYRSDHLNEQAEAAAASRLTELEGQAEELQADLGKNILSRYHEEQIWSDKIRQASTWGTWGLMGFNVLLFATTLFLVEPWKRRKLVSGFEDRVRTVLKEEGIVRKEGAVGATAAPAEMPSVEDVKAQAVDQEALVARLSAAMEESQKVLENYVSLASTTRAELEIDPPLVGAVSSASPTSPRSSLDIMRSAFAAFHQAPMEIIRTVFTKENVQAIVPATKASVESLVSEEQISLSRKDVTVIAAESAVAGAVLMGLITWMLRG
ncbi:hypothetical protein G7K_3651-t1 [Saitoella complicata NRRL Y-17804]|uniref:Sensitive to high expression protein 9, mitochondrial n=2 Tax=Saitoella complicata (strain BCRC 22490 / CBS 7301 / JCM 7358 / NBRC 10748 / NRRL Y-17804) TaxID=698492 RepID=A0A0E9NI09_SAICN|nr:hypothetical protein G7K_3651-t1 [Saitoella complicata NRRL Y-17804]